MPCPAIFYAGLVLILAHSLAFADAAASKYVDPDSTEFRFERSELSGIQFCKIQIALTRAAPNIEPVGQIVYLTVVILRNQSGEIFSVYELRFLGSGLVHGIPTEPKSLRVVSASIESDIFSSKNLMSLKAINHDSIVYQLKDEKDRQNYLKTIIRGYYYLKLELYTGAELTYIVRSKPPQKTVEAWLACSRRISE